MIYKTDGFNNVQGWHESWYIDKHNPRIEVVVKGVEL